ncbi:MAG: hypothetical protein RBS05_17925 [Zoogloea oleivorans]|jgi:hypothetical protein|uniref:hypothetical protein n=1 Tax=Zoogloea oleivorans TaxID=1552750 RepID=UPI002A370A3C|nr:hypothetical protein [Zoogloea oleivorans]MDY0037794.1 hypothetical protein [Zoogloea oleivorans]
MLHEDSRMVYLFSVHSQRMDEYPKAFARTVLTSLKGADRSAAIEAYKKWYADSGETFLKRDESRRRMAILERNAEEEARRHDAIARHKAYLEKLGKHYAGVSENSTRSHRATHCYACKAHLDSDLHIECQSCNWLICYCGACGCGYQI